MYINLLTLHYFQLSIHSNFGLPMTLVTYPKTPFLCVAQQEELGKEISLS
jgi:hypothetical protein